VIIMRFVIYAIVFATSFTVVALLIVLAIPIGTAIDCPICTNKTAIALIALGSALAGAVLSKAGDRDRRNGDQVPQRILLRLPCIPRDLIQPPVSDHLASSP
jgi:hypothetical protein